MRGEGGSRAGRQAGGQAGSRGQAGCMYAGRASGKGWRQGVGEGGWGRQGGRGKRARQAGTHALSKSSRHSQLHF